MRNISSKTDNVGDTLPASDFNANLRVELQSIVTDVGLTLDPEGGPDTDLDMFGKALVMYANASQYYVDTGSVDTYEIDRVGNLQPLSSYVDGVTVTFKAANSNTGASTLDVDGLGAKDLVDSGGSAISAGVVVAGQYVTARYNGLTDDFELITSAGSSLTTWINLGDDFLPIVSGTGTLGDTTHLVEGIYLGDSNHIYLGDSQDFNIYHDGTNCNLFSNTGFLNLGTTTTSAVYFLTDSTNRWVLTSTALRPVSGATQDLGSPSARVNDYYGANIDLTGNILLDDDQYVYFGNSNDASIRFTSAFSFQILNTGGQSVVIRAASGFGVYIGDGAINRYVADSSKFYPGVTATYDLGSTTYRWDTIYSVNALNVSDFRYKEEIKPINLGLDFINSLNPISFKLTEIKDDRTRYGLIAQQIDEILSKFGMTYEDFSGIHYDKDSDRWDMDYTQFIGPIIKAIQELSRGINDQIKQ